MELIMNKSFYWRISAVICFLIFYSPAFAGDYVLHDDGTLTDNLTGLDWQRKDDNIKRDWKSAVGYCLNLKFAGHDDWRLPNHYELRTIRSEGKKYPAVDQDAFPETKAEMYWSATELPYSDDLSFNVNFGKKPAGISVKENQLTMKWTNKYYSRCIRGKRKKIEKK